MWYWLLLIVTLVLVTQAITDEQEDKNPPLRSAKQLSKLPYCHKNPHLLNPASCSHNNTYCGEWHNRFFYPFHCQYRNITAEQGRTCMRNRTLACLGDSMTRDLCVGLYMLLSGKAELYNSADEKFDKRSDDHWKSAEKIAHIPRFIARKTGVPHYEGMLFPKIIDAKEYDWDFQIQIWEQPLKRMQKNMIDILNNELIEINNNTINLRKIDFAIWQHGIHDYGWFKNPPYGQGFADRIYQLFLQNRETVQTPVTWTAMNPNCKYKIQQKHVVSRDQPGMVEEINNFILNYSRANHLPYFDTAMPLRIDSDGLYRRCHFSGDGVHVKMWVDVMRAKILLNHLCDDDLNWIASVNRFVGF